MRKELEQYINLMEFFSATVGDTFEAGVFDMTDPEYPLAASSNGHKKVQEKVRAFIAEAADSRMAQIKGYIANHPIVIDTKLIKVSIYFIRAEAGTTIGALWLSMSCDILMKMSNFISNMMQFNIEDINSDEIEVQKENRRELSLDCITEVISEFGADSGRTTLAERQEIICNLFDMGVFEIKGSVARTAEELQISEQSVYRYISKIKKCGSSRDSEKRYGHHIL